MVHDSFVRTGHLTAFVDCMVTVVIVKRAHKHSVLCGLAFFPIYRNLCVTVAENSLSTNLSTSLPVSGVSGPNLIFPGTTQEPDRPEAVLPLQAAAAAMWRDCHAKSYAEYSDHNLLAAVRQTQTADLQTCRPADLRTCRHVRNSRGVEIYSQYARKNLDLLEQGPRGIGR